MHGTVSVSSVALLAGVHVPDGAPVVAHCALNIFALGVSRARLHLHIWGRATGSLPGRCDRS